MEKFTDNQRAAEQEYLTTRYQVVPNETAQKLRAGVAQLVRQQSALPRCRFAWRNVAAGKVHKMGEDGHTVCHVERTAVRLTYGAAAPSWGLPCKNCEQHSWR